jgi:hypothetical protein
MLTASISFACTTAVVSGKHTRDGRPLLWKHRDTWAIHNKIMQFHDGKYEYTGLVNSQDSLGKSVWIGFNSTGFAIMNSASYNLNNDSIEQSGLEGRIIKQALQNCSTVDEFEQMLNQLPKPTRLEANFGVIDGNGGAAYVELGNFNIVKVDANDPLVAPNGYLIRTNFSFSGEAGKGGGYIRYVTASKVFDEAVKNNELSAQAIIQHASRNLSHGLTGDDLHDYASLPADREKMVFFVDYIPRRGSSSSCVVEGVNTGEDPNLTTMWTVLGWPLASVCVPVFLTKDESVPTMLDYNASLGDAPLCHLALELKDRCYSYKWGTCSKYYVNINKLLNADGSGIMQKNQDVENNIFDMSYKLLARWREEGRSEKDIQPFYDSIDKILLKHFKQAFGLDTDESWLKR